MYEFDCPKSLTLALRLAGGSIDVTAEDRTTATVDVEPFDDSSASREAAAQTRVDLTGDTLLVVAPNQNGVWRRSARLRVTVRLPLDARLSVVVASADTRLRGRYADAKVNTASGDIHIDHVTGALKATGASGDIVIGRADRQAEIHTASGRIEVGHAGRDLGLRTSSGDISIGEAAGSVHATTASGGVRVAAVRQGSVRLKTASGDVAIGVTAGTGVWLDLQTVSGGARSDLRMGDGEATDPHEADLELRARTVSGDIHVYRATPANGDRAAA